MGTESGQCSDNETQFSSPMTNRFISPKRPKPLNSYVSLYQKQMIMNSNSNSNSNSTKKPCKYKKFAIGFSPISYQNTENKNNRNENLNCKSNESVVHVYSNTKSNSEIDTEINSPQTEKDLNQLAQNISDALTMNTNTKNKNKKSKPKPQPDLVFSVNVNQQNIEEIPLQSDNVNISKFVESE